MTPKSCTCKPSSGSADIFSLHPRFSAFIQDSRFQNPASRYAFQYLQNGSIFAISTVSTPDVNRNKSKLLSHNVYVIELDKRVWSDSKKFREANPQYRGVSNCLYVGMTSNTPEDRFEKHVTGHRTKKGIKISSRIVEKYGRYLRPSLYAPLNPLTKSRAIQLEKDLANSLKKRGYAVWWN